MECVQRVPVSTESAPAYGTPLSDCAGHRLVANSYSGHESKWSGAEDRESDRAGRVHQEDRLYIAAHDSLWARRDLWKRAGFSERRWTRRHISDGRQHI